MGFLCKGKTDLFFSEDNNDIKEAKRLCYKCPIYWDCKAYGLKLPKTTEGIFGGLTRREREAERRRNRYLNQRKRLSQTSSEEVA